MQLLKFSTDRVAFSGNDVLFDYQVQNNGNQDLVPSGDIRIYDRRGEEVATLDVNKEEKTVSPQQNAELASVWSAVQGFGQYKALITVNYGKTQAASVQDTVFFWIVPWKQLLGIFTALAVVLAILALYFSRWFEERHLNKLAIAGLLKTDPATAAAIADAARYVPLIPAHQEHTPIRHAKKAERDAPHKDRLIVRVVGNIVIAWRLFTTFKKRGRLTPQDIADERAATMPKSDVYSEYPAQADEHDTLENYEDTYAYDSQEGTVLLSGETIDLKNMQPQNQEVLNEAHVVNLKKQP
jgi:hypothetical protein